jgi:hypothetical protein
MPSQIQVVTALFDIGREFDDGRTVEEYLLHLSRLLTVYPNTIVFHDCIVPSFQEQYPYAKFVKVMLSELETWKFHEQISHICLSYRERGFSDLVYRNPKYGVVIHSKFELLKRSSAYSNAKFFLWLDAAVFRFIPGNHSPRVALIGDELGGAEFFEISVWHNLSIWEWVRHGKLIPVPEIGSSKRIIGAATFILDRVAVLEYEFQSSIIIQKWLDSFVWDTEQVLLGLIMKSRNVSRYFVQPRNTPTKLLSVILKSPLLKNSIFLPRFISRLLF